MKKILYILICVITLKISKASDIIIHNSVENQKIISNNLMLPIFTKRQKTWSNGEKIIVFIKPIDSLEHTIFLAEWLGISSYRYKKILKRELYSGNTTNVKEVSTEDEMVISVLMTPNSIGYLLSGELIYSYIDEKSKKIVVIKYD